MSGLDVPDPGFADDDGSADPLLVAALASGDEAQVQAALVGARVFVPLMALLGESTTGPDGSTHEKSSDITVVTILRPDGARALPVFTSTAALAAWDARARPLPVEGPRAALATYSEDAIALLVDPGRGPTAVIFGPMLLALAEGRRWAPALHDEDVTDAVGEHVPPGVGWRLKASSEADATLVLTYPASTSPEEARVSSAEVARVLADVPLIRARLAAGLDVVAEIAG